MKKILLSILFVSVSLMAVDSVAGAEKYVKKCAVCHGANAKKIPIKGMKPIAGMKITKLVKILRYYQAGAPIGDWESNVVAVGHGFSREMIDSTMYLSQRDMDNIGVYVNSLK